MTSRGLLAVEHSHLLKMGLNKQKFLERALPVVKKAKPLHIVFDGALWYARFALFFEYLFRCQWERLDWLEAQFSVRGSRFDFTQADVCFLDLQTSLCHWDHDSFFTLRIWPDYDDIWHLDHQIPPGLAEGWLPIDVIFPGNESDAKNMASLVAVERRKTSPLPLNPSLKYSRPFSERAYSFGFDVSAFSLAREYLQDVLWLRKSCWTEDKGLGGFSGEWLPSDIAIPGNEDSKDVWVLVALKPDYLFSLYVKPLLSDTSEADYELSTDFHNEIALTNTREAAPRALYACLQDSLDSYPAFDSVAADFSPLDMPIGGVYA